MVWGASGEGVSATKKLQRPSTTTSSLRTRARRIEKRLGRTKNWPVRRPVTVLVFLSECHHRD